MTPFGERKNMPPSPPEETGSTKPPVEVAPLPEDHWLNTPFETLSEKDRDIFLRLRKAFEKRGPNQQWYYSAAGTDMVPLCVAPDGTTHHFVDPYYKRPDHLLQKDLESSFLRSAETTDTATGAETKLPDGSIVKWIGDTMENPDTVPASLDVVYSNTLSAAPHPLALEHLKVGGIYIMEGDRKGKQIKIENPLLERSLTDSGFRLVQQGIAINRFNIQDAGGLSPYGINRRKEFDIYEKERDLTPNEVADLFVNDVVFELMKKMRGLAFVFEKSELPPEHILPLIRSEIVEDCQLAFQDFTTQIAEHLSADAQKHAMQTFMDRLGKNFFNDDSQRSVMHWLFEADQKMGQTIFARVRPEASVQDVFQAELLKVINEVGIALEAALLG